MMKSEVIKNKKKKPLTLSTVNNIINTYTTLSDRLKQAGIKESKPKYEGKASKNKNTKAKKNSFKMSYSEDYMNNQNPGDRIKKLQKPLKNYVIPYMKDCFPNYDSCAEKVSKNPKDFSKDLSESVQDKTTIFVSLDFIEDCQKYKRKIRKGNWHLKSQKSIKNLFSNQNKYVDNKGGPQEFPEGISSIDNQSSHYGDMEINLLDEKKGEEKKFYSVTENSLENPNTELAINGPLEGKGAFFNKMSSDDIAKIDKKYLQSLLSCIRNNEGKVPAYESKQSEEIPTQSLPEKKKKITGKDYFERIVKTKELLDECFSNIDDSRKRLGEKQNEYKGAIEYPQSGIISTRVVRDLAKSEEQIKLKKAKNFYTYNNSNVKNKNVTYSKPDIKDDRKQRKPRNKFMKNNVKVFIETSFPTEVSKVADVKELWRRETQKKSENSLTSYSSCTVPESDDFSGSKNLESYRVLKKLVGEEINNIANKSENKVKTKEIKTKKNPNLESLNKSEQEKNICTKFISPTSGNSNDLRAKERPVVKRRLMAAESGEYNMAYEDHMQKTQNSGIHVEDITNEANPKMKRLQENTKQAGKLPGQVIENWSILNRLEQAFLGLGAPTLQKNVKDSSTQKGKRHNTGDEKSNAGGQKSDTDHPKESKKAQIGKDVFAKMQDRESDNAVLTNLKKKEETPSKIPKIIETEQKLKEKYRANKSKKDSKQEALQTNITMMSTCDESGVMQIKKKSQIRPHTSSSEKIHLKSVSRNTKTENNEDQLKQETTSRTQIKSKIQKMYKSQTSEIQLLNSNLATSADNLERKKTFDVISVMDTSVIQPRKSKSCDMNDGNIERLSHSKSKDPKSDGTFLNLSKKTSKLRIANDTGSKFPAIRTMLAKDPVTDKPLQTCQNLKYVGEKKCLKPSKLPKSRVNQENKNEKPVTMEQAPQHTPFRAEINKTITNNNNDNIKRINKNRLGNNSKTKINNSNTNINKRDNTVNVICKDTNTNSNTNEKPPLANDGNILRERAVKKRSILSVHINQTPRKSVKIKEKDNSDCTLENPQNYLNSSQNGFKTTYSNASVKSMGAYDMVNDQNLRNHVTNKSSEFSITKTQGKFDILPRLNSSSLNSTLCYEGQDQEQDRDIEQGRGESKTSKTRPLWEQDISHYHTIVREIMSQYKRIDGFLKQTEHLNICSSDSVNFETLNDDDSNKSYDSFNNSQMLNKEEYRKKIISEYTELPIFEYKSKLRRSKNGNFGPVGARKNLSVAKDSKTDADVGIKDYHPKIQKVLDSQLYVDTERLTKQNEPKVKFKEKNSSLQEILTCENRKTLESERWKRSFSAPKTLFSRNSPLTLFCAPTLSSVNKSLGSISMTGYSQETENESFREITGK